MKTELEQEFFKVFEIEPIPIKNYGFWLIKGSITENDKGEKVVYPEITAEKLLELVYIIGVKPYGFLYLNDTYSTNINSKTDIILVEADDFREGVLTLAIQPRVALRIKKQVRALFKGEE